jgi:hypothetical protein
MNIVPGVEALRGQNEVEVDVTMADGVRSIIAEAPLEALAIARLRQAGLIVTPLARPGAVKPLLWVYIDGAQVGGEFIYSVYLEYYGLLQVPGISYQRLAKAGVYVGGFEGISPITTAAETVMTTVGASIESFLNEAYLTVNQPGQKRASVPAGAEIVAVAQALKAANGASEIGLAVTVDTDLPVTEEAARAAAERAATQAGFKVVSGASLARPLATVNVTGFVTSDGRYVYGVHAHAKRLLRLPTAEFPPVVTLADVARPNQAVGMGRRDHAVTDILETVEGRVAEIVASLKKVNESGEPAPWTDEGNVICSTLGYIPTRPPQVVDEILKIAAVTSRDVVYDIGVGDGAVLVAAARSGARGVGHPLCLLGATQATQNAAVAGVTDRVRFVSVDPFSEDADLRDATVVVLFMIPNYVQRILPRLARELKAGSRVFSLLPGGGCHPPDKTIRLSNGSNLFSQLHSWTVPFKDTCAAPAGAGVPRNR